MERVLIFLKPDGLELALEPMLTNLLSREDISILEECIFQLDAETVRKLYELYQDAWFFNQLIEYLTSGRSKFFVCEGVNARAKIKAIRGNSYDCSGLRGGYSSCPVRSADGRLVLLKNVMHMSDPGDFQKEYDLLKTRVV